MSLAQQKYTLQSRFEIFVIMHLLNLFKYRLNHLVSVSVTAYQIKLNEETF